jgi:hypothetical protein
LDDFIQAKAKVIETYCWLTALCIQMDIMFHNSLFASPVQVSPSVSFDATSMNELRKWNEQYGEGGSRSKSPFGFGS